MSFPPLPSPEELAEIRQSTMGDLAPVTVCTACGWQDIWHRLGCKCGGEVKHLWRDRSDSLLEYGVDFSFILIENLGGQDGT